MKEKVTWYFIHMGRRGRFHRILAITGFAVCLLAGRLWSYFQKSGKRFVCAGFILLCFMVGNSFAFPVFQNNEENGFLSEEGDQVAVAGSDIVLLQQEKSFSDVPFLEDEDVLEGYNDSELCSTENTDKFSLDEILEGNAEYLPERKEENAQAERKALVPEKDRLSFSKDDWRLVLINKQHPISEDYSFTLGNIKTIKGNMQCDERIIEDLLLMMQKAREDGVNLAICSPYRDLNRQEVLFNRKIKAYMGKGMSYMEAYKVSSQTVTVPGASEHQIGLAIDIISDDYITLDEGFADTDAGKWLKENSCEYGFILRYPKDKEYITGIQFEPWHFRYVGKEAACVMTEEGITLEEFWDKYL